MPVTVPWAPDSPAVSGPRMRSTTHRKASLASRASAGRETNGGGGAGPLRWGGGPGAGAPTRVRPCVVRRDYAFPRDGFEGHGAFGVHEGQVISARERVPTPIVVGDLFGRDECEG